MTSRGEQRSPNLRHLAHEVEEDLAGTRAVRRDCKRSINVTAVINQRNIGRLVNAEHFLEQRIGKLFRVRLRKTDTEPVVEISLRTVCRKIQAEFVDAK